MKTLQTLSLAALLFTLLAWLSLQGVSNATVRISPARVPEKNPVAAKPLPPKPTKAPKAITPPKAASTAPKRNKTPSPFQVALEAGDLCEVSRLLSGGYQSKEIYQALIAVMSPSPTLQEAYGESGPMLDPNSPHQAKDTHDSTKLLRALRAAGLLYAPGGNGSEDAQAALETLKSLEQKNSGNAFYPFLRLAVEEKLGRSEDELKETAALLLSASQFHSELQALDREFRQAAWISPAMHYALANIYGGLSPTYYQSINLIRRLADGGKFSGTKELAHLMMEPGLRARRSFNTGEYDLNQYNFGQSLVYGLPGTLDAGDLEAEKSQRQLAYPTQPWITDTVSGERRCDPGPYETYFYEAREAR